jgi:hypothetical protein
MEAVLRQPQKWWNYLTITQAFLRLFILWAMQLIFSAAGITRELKDLMLVSGPDGTGMKLECTAALYALVLASICREYRFANLVELATASLTVVDIGMGLGGFTMVLVILGFKVWGVEKDHEPFKTVCQLALKRSLVLRGEEGKCKPVKARDLDSWPYTLPWRFHQPAFKLQDVRNKTFAGNPTRTNVIIALHGGLNPTLVNSFHALAMMLILPPMGRWSS